MNRMGWSSRSFFFRPHGAPVVRSDAQPRNEPQIGEGILQAERALESQTAPRKEQGPGPPTEPLRVLLVKSADQAGFTFCA